MNKGRKKPEVGKDTSLQTLIRQLEEIHGRDEMGLKSDTPSLQKHVKFFVSPSPTVNFNSFLLLLLFIFIFFNKEKHALAIHYLCNVFSLEVRIYVHYQISKFLYHRRQRSCCLQKLQVSCSFATYTCIIHYITNIRMRAKRRR